MASPQQALHLAIDEAHAGQRIDNFLVTCLKGVPKSHLYRLLRKGEVRVNKARIKPDYRLNLGDDVRIPPVRRDIPKTPTAPRAATQRLEERVLYEDAALLVLNKPTGMAVHGGSGQSFGVIEALRALRPYATFLELVHRLDRETSGCLLIAKKPALLRALHQSLRSGAMEKRYLTLLQGRWERGPHRVDLPLSKNVLQSGERMVRVDPRGKSASTLFQPRRVFAEASLMEVVPLTGRTHQIRVHAASLGCSVAGDEKYGNPDFNRDIRRCGLVRLFLHAQAVAIRRPDTGERVRFEAPLDEDLERVLLALDERSRKEGVPVVP
jgi:23S rRNA pseudouridine955/2504/2580 synthase